MLAYDAAYFSFSGRASRGEFARVSLRLVYATVFVVLAAIFGAMQGLAASGYLAAALIAAIWLANVAVAVRRLHDRGLSGWFAVIVLPFPLVEAAARGIPILLLPIVLLDIWLFIEVYIRRGVRGANQYGADPLAEA
jgi:uncharacterized membrane protein YhaH (DUF805 family)